MRCVTARSLWTDLQVGRLLEWVFELPFEFLAPDLIVETIETPAGSMLVGKGLQSIPLSGDQVLLLMELSARYPLPPRADLSALVLARAEQCHLLTSQGDLHKTALAEGIEVADTLWLLEQMIDHTVVTEQQVITAVKQMMSVNRSLSSRAVAARLERWEQQKAIVL